MEFNSYMGTCKYCGQMIPIMAADQMDADLKISADCECGGHKKELQHKAMIKKIESIFGEKAPDYNLKPVNDRQLAMIRGSAESVFADEVSSVTVGLGGITAKISKTAKGNIKIVRTQTRSIQEEA